MDKSVKFRIVLETNGEKVLHTMSVNADDLREAVGGVVSEAKNMNSTFESMAGFAVFANSAMNALTQLQDCIGGLAAEYNTFDQSMRAVNTMAGKDAAGFGALTEQVNELATQVPLAKDEIANGLYQVISSGVPEDNWISFLAASSKSAVGGIANLGETVAVTSTVIKNYGLSWSDAQAVQDKIQMTAKNGVTTFEQLASALPRVSGNAATLGVTVDELMASFATLTGVSGDTAEVSTQLGAIFTALVKPSSEAIEMAQQMGIEFDAASIKAAGGMKNFVTELDADVKQYAASHDMLAEEIYGKLFGSAESLRAMIPLTGELADTFGKNVESMKGSAGTIDAAFGEMSGSGQAVNQILKNQVSTMTEWAGSLASGIEPYLSYVAVTGQALIGMNMLRKSLVACEGAIYAMTAANNRSAVASVLAGVHARVQGVAQNILAASGYTAATGTTALTVATVALYAALTMGISVVITGLASVMGELAVNTSDAADAECELAKEQASANDAAAQASSEREREAVLLKETRSGMELYIAKLKNFKGSKADEKKIVGELNDQYGETMGYFSSVSDWYTALVANSKSYCDQMVIEAKTRLLANQIAQNEQAIDNIRHDKNGKSRMYSTERKTHTEAEKGVNADGTVVIKSIKTVSEASDWDKATAKVNGLTKDVVKQRTELDKLSKSSAKVVMPMRGSTVRPGGVNQGGTVNGSGSGDGDDQVIVKNAKSYAELANNIGIWKKALEEANPADVQMQKTLVANIGAAEDAQDAIRAYQDALGHKVDLSSLDGINAEIQYQSDLRGKASAENIGGIDREMKRLVGLKSALEACGHTDVVTEQIGTYAALDDEVGYYEEKLKHATVTERAEVEAKLKELRKLRKGWDDLLAELDAPAEIGALDSMEALDDALNYYSTLQKRKSGDEVTEIQRTVNALTKKRDAMDALTKLPEMERETAELDGLSGKTLKVKLEAIGLDGIADKIKELRAMLNDDTGVRKTDGQQQEIRNLIAQYEKYEKVAKKSGVTVNRAWGSVKGVGDSIDGMSDALTGNGNAWKKVSGIVDGVIGLYDGFNAVVGIVNALTGASETHTAVKAVEGATDTSAAAASSAAGATEVASSVAQTAALSAETSAWSALSAARTFAAHAYLPFIGTATAAGMVATQQTVIAAAALPKFADGGIAYGPTLGIFGEYSGAAQNPEVVAPLDKLKGLLGDGGGIGGFGVSFKIRGSDLVGVIANETRISGKSGRRTNIRL